MKLSYEFIRSLVESAGWESCSEYGEPGYSVKEGGYIVFGNFNEGPNEDKYPRIWRQMEHQGIEFEWSDEWTVDYSYNKAYRTEPDSYQWQRAFTYTDDGEGMLTPDDEFSEWLEYAINRVTRCVNNRQCPDLEKHLTEAGFVKYNDHQYENGYHHGSMNDKPQDAVDHIRQEHGEDTEFFFVHTEQSQFYMGFDAWWRPAPTEDDDEGDEGQHSSIENYCVPCDGPCKW